jgi:hypothetical protein
VGLIDVHLVKKLPAFYGTKRFITVSPVNGPYPEPDEFTVQKSSEYRPAPNLVLVVKYDELECMFLYATVSYCSSF